MRIDQIAAQLFTVRDLATDAASLAHTLRRIRNAGYLAVQISGMPALPEIEMQALLDDTGLICCATHEPGDKILRDPQGVARRLQALRCTETAYPYPVGVPLATLEDVRAWVKALDESGRVLREEGITLSYHNHQIEFRRVSGKLILEILYDETDPMHLQGEIDTYWVQYGGGDPVEWCERLENRLPILHMKDYQITPDNSPTFAEIGYGNFDWHRIIAAAENSGCRWFVVEQDICPGDPVDSLAKSFDYIAQNLLA